MPKYESLPSLKIGDLEVSLPIIQGGMGIQVSRAPLASAVAACGGAGTISGVGLGFGKEQNELDFITASREGLRREIRAAKEAGPGVVGVNLLVAVSNYEDLVRVCAEEKADFIASGAGLPLRLPEYTKGSPIKLIPIVSSGRAADLIINAWAKRYNRLPDAIIVEGAMAGGHLGFSKTQLMAEVDKPLELLVKETIQVMNTNKWTIGKNIPIIAAGGLFDGKDIARFLKLGAAGVQLATRFVTTEECSVSDKFKQMYLEAKAEDVVIIDSPVGMPGRALRTKLVDDVASGHSKRVVCNYRCLRGCNPLTAPYCIASALVNAVNGNIDEAVVFCGTNVSRIDKIVTVKELLDELTQETLDELNRE